MSARTARTSSDFYFVSILPSFHSFTKKKWWKTHQIHKPNVRSRLRSASTMRRTHIQTRYTTAVSWHKTHRSNNNDNSNINRHQQFIYLFGYEFWVANEKQNFQLVFFSAGFRLAVAIVWTKLFFIFYRKHVRSSERTNEWRWRRRWKLQTRRRSHTHTHRLAKNRVRGIAWRRRWRRPQRQDVKIHKTWASERTRVRMYFGPPHACELHWRKQTGQ